MSDDERIAFINEIMDDYCKECGREMLGTWLCHCTNDE